jgi:hypothetical protein
MERVAFLVEETGERISCLLNPASVVVRRLAGVRPRQSGTGPLTGAALKDDPVLYTGGGMTEILLDLLFDVSLAGTNRVAEDVRDLTRQLTELAEGAEGADGYGQVPLVRFVWGKSWNVLGIVTAVAERLEYFTLSGAPQRSWLRMRFLRVGDSTQQDPGTLGEDLPLSDLPEEMDVPADRLRFHQIKGAGGAEDEGSDSERLDQIAAVHYGNPAWWRLIAAFNGIEDPSDISPGRLLMIPPDPSAGGNA